ncbi:C40 family peptidase [Mycolicibacterium madagascariense]|uniref:C40 family peptidase n=1 Tax=Mycolicibacterium madagascariense TaxID=212765 RepID=UPI0021F2D296|nr:C40 family peptidase [Mycolicibacterium madagascariense]MCV7015940.1 C40 family peptidase [Mycolicibacterium madagascariense]
MHRCTRGLRRPIVGALAGLMIAGGVVAGGVHADPSEDAVAKLNQLSRQAEETTEAMHSAELDLGNKLQAQRAAEQKHAADVAAVDAAKAQLATFQTSVDKVAAAQYMGGRTSGLDAMLTANSPQLLIDQLSVQRVMATEMSAQMQNFKSSSVAANQAEVESAKSAAAPPSVDPGDVAPPPDAAPAPNPDGEGMVAVQAALTRIGSPYSWGAAGPGAFDCSGLVMWAFGQAGVNLPHSSQALAQGGQPVSMDQMQPGDLITYYSDASHVGIYIGDGMMVHASTYGTPVRVAPVDNAPIHNVRRY